MSWPVPWTDLNPQQKAGVGLPPHGSVIIEGSKLCGKTLTLLHRAGHLRDLYHLSGSQLQIWVASEGMKNLLRSVAHLFHLDPHQIERYDEWCSRIYRIAVQDDLPEIPLIGGTDFALLRIFARQAVQWGLGKGPSFDVLLVDELDAFSSADISFMTSLARHITLTTAGERQSAELACLVQATGRQEMNKIALPTSYRRNSSIAELSALFRPSGSSTAENCTEAVVSTEKESPTYYIAADEQTEIAQLADVLGERMRQHESIGIFQPRLRDAADLATSLRHIGMEVELESNSINRSFPEPSFATNVPKIFTFDSARGLNFESVIVPRLTRRNFRGYDDHGLRIVLSEAISRAAKWVYLSRGHPNPLPQLETAEIMGRPDVLHVIGKTHVSTRAAVPENETDLSFSDIDSLL